MAKRLLGLLLRTVLRRLHRQPNLRTIHRQLREAVDEVRELVRVLNNAARVTHEAAVARLAAAGLAQDFEGPVEDTRRTSMDLHVVILTPLHPWLPTQIPGVARPTL